MVTKQHVLPEGLVLHCEKCRIVIPTDAPKLPDSYCEWVAAAKLTWFDPNTTRAGQHCMAVAAWELVYHRALTEGHAEGIEYKQKFKLKRKEHYAESAVFKALSPEHIQTELNHEAHGRRDEWLYKEGKSK